MRNTGTRANVLIFGHEMCLTMTYVQEPTKRFFVIFPRSSEAKSIFSNPSQSVCATVFCNGKAPYLIFCAFSLCTTQVDGVTLRAEWSLLKAKAVSTSPELAQCDSLASLLKKLCSSSVHRGDFPAFIKVCDYLMGIPFSTAGTRLFCVCYVCSTTV